MCIFSIVGGSALLKRNVEEKLNIWKNTKNRKCLLVRGARQVGKTFSIESFGKAGYESCVTINFLKNPGYKRIFAENLDSKTLLMNISLYVPQVQLVPGKTLLFLDEIQAYPHLLRHVPAAKCLKRTVRSEREKSSCTCVFFLVSYIYGL